LIAFRESPDGSVDRLLARGLAVLVEEGIVTLELLPAPTLKPRRLTGGNPPRRQRRLQALAEAAADRLAELSAVLDREDPIADEQLIREVNIRAGRHHRDRVAAALSRTRELAVGG
jgi:hypothetical protein